MKIKNWISSLFSKKNISNRYLLTDFTSERWKNVDLKSVEDQIKSVQNRLKEIGILYGEISPPDHFDITINKVSHTIENITLENGKVYGDVTFLRYLKNGRLAYNKIKNGARFGIRCAGIHGDNIVFKKIYTWDIL